MHAENSDTQVSTIYKIQSSSLFTSDALNVVKRIILPVDSTESQSNSSQTYLTNCFKT